MPSEPDSPKQDPAAYAIQERDFLLSSAIWQDRLLQGYRQMHLTVHSILLAIGIGLVVVILNAQEGESNVALPAILLALAAGSLVLLRFMRNIVLARGLDVDWWHVELLLAENRLPKSALRYFRRFKLHQRLRRGRATFLEELCESKEDITLEQARNVVGSGRGHTRWVVDEIVLFRGLVAVWLAAIGLAIWSLLR